MILVMASFENNQHQHIEQKTGLTNYEKKISSEKIAENPKKNPTSTFSWLLDYYDLLFAFCSRRIVNGILIR
jgi:hypothetical protein